MASIVHMYLISSYFFEFSQTQNKNVDTTVVGLVYIDSII
jgi:hypothetical protein